MYGTYQRLRVHVSASDSDVIRAARAKLKPSCWHDTSYREGRKLFYRNMLDYHHKAREMVREWRL
jgi:hypothetical protein